MRTQRKKRSRKLTRAQIVRQQAREAVGEPRPACIIDDGSWRKWKRRYQDDESATEIPEPGSIATWAEDEWQ